MDKDTLTDRLTKTHQAKQAAFQQHAQLQAGLTETVAQINALIGREAELTELLALVNEPKDAAASEGA